MEIGILVMKYRIEQISCWVAMTACLLGISLARADESLFLENKWVKTGADPNKGASITWLSWKSYPCNSVNIADRLDTPMKRHDPAASPPAPGPTKLFEQAPEKITEKDHVVLVDFGKVAFGNLKLTAPKGVKREIIIRFGEDFKDGAINRKPPGTVRFSSITFQLDGSGSQIAAPPADARNTSKATAAHPPAILTPAEWGVLTPFRWVEIDGWPGELDESQIRRRASFVASWDDDAAAFSSSNKTLDEIWELCRYTIKATSFTGLYVDGDRERIPYEADSHLNQLSHYYCDDDIQMARDTYDYLINYSTWPSEWAPHMIFIAYADYMRTGDTDWLAARYEKLKTKTLAERVGADFLVSSSPKQIRNGDIVDWPERDGYVFTSRNTVVNAFHLIAMKRMGEMAEALGKLDEAKDFFARAARSYQAFQSTFFDEKAGVYRDGVGTKHSSIHANLFPLAFGLVQAENRASVIAYLKTKRMACTVYAAQYLLQGLFENGAADYALELILADGDRSWKHMLNSGTTITWEAWDQKYKPNQDWTHAWAAAPANILPRFILGVTPHAPGWKSASINPLTGGLSHAKGKIPTPRGPIMISWENEKNFTMELDLPDDMPAIVSLPADEKATRVLLNSAPTPAKRVGDRFLLELPVAGKARLEVK